ncbi:hypothetical protein Xph01_02030 [Micromonospora phaseoli]|nr:hypothetical protein Xph01_02030 [Micromonospora phaseoli]
MVVTRLRPGRSGRSWTEEITCDDRTDREVDRPVDGPPLRAGAALAAPRGAAALRAGAAPAVDLRAAVPAVDLRAAVLAVAFRGADLRAPVVDLRAALVVDLRAAPARVPEVFVALARPAGPLLRRPAPPDRSAFASVFTSSGLRSAEMPETPYRRNCPLMSSTRICEISDSEIRAVFGPALRLCRLVPVAVPPRPELFR